MNVYPESHAWLVRHNSGLFDDRVSFRAKLVLISDYPEFYFTVLDRATDTRIFLKYYFNVRGCDGPLISKIIMGMWSKLPGGLDIG